MAGTAVEYPEGMDVTAPSSQLQYSWSFGDGGTSTAAAVSHTFPSGSTYTVQLTATDGWGKSSSMSRQVTVP